MDELPNNERLLDDVLAEETDPVFREALLGQTLHLVRRKQRFRKIGRVASGVAVFAALLLMVWNFVPSRSNVPTSPVKTYTLVRTQALPPAAIVETKPFTDLTTTSTSVMEIILTSASAHEFGVVNDDQLLELVPASAILVRRGPHTAELVFANPADEQAVVRYQ
jgi:hypothetical protein